MYTIPKSYGRPAHANAFLMPSTAVGTYLVCNANRLLLRCEKHGTDRVRVFYPQNPSASVFFGKQVIV